MTTTTANEVKNLENVVSNTNFVKGAKIKEIGTYKVQLLGAEKRTFEVTLNIAKNVFLACEYLKTEDCKKLLKDANCTLTIEQMGINVFQYKRSFFMELKKCGGLEVQVVEDFKNSGNVQSIKGLLEFSKGGVNSEGEGEGEGEGEVKVKDENLKISVTKDGKITIKGTAKKEIYTLLIQELNKMMSA